jgi:hypothetical protein
MSARRATLIAISSPDRFRRVGAAAALIGSAMVHATVVSDHYRGWALAGLFFLALQLTETALGLAVLLAWSRRVASAVVACNLATLGVWALSRTAGLPFGPEGFRAAEPVGAADLACVVLELAAVALVLPRALGRSSPPTAAVSSRRGAGALALAAVLAILAVTGWGLGPAVSGDGHQHQHTAALD